MRIERLQFTLPAGQNKIQSASLIMAQVLKCYREGREFDGQQNSTITGTRNFFKGTLIVGGRPRLGNLLFKDDALVNERLIVIAKYTI